MPPACDTTRLACAMVFTAVGHPLQRRTVPLPTAASDQCLIRIQLTTLCGSDLHSHSGQRPTPRPIILGHESIGVVCRQPGDAACTDATGQPLAAGDRVTWCLVDHCGQCFYCERGLPQKCESMVKYGHRRFTDSDPLSGGLATHCLLGPRSSLFRVPNSIPDRVACPANCATATAAAACRTAGPLSGQTVLVQGCGLLGLTTTAMARVAGADRVIVTDTNAQRLDSAAAFGASHTICLTEASSQLEPLIRDVSQGRGADIVFEMSGSPAAISSGLKLLRIGGSYIWVGSVFPSEAVPIHAEDIVRGMLRIEGVHNYQPQDLQHGLTFLEHHGQQFPFASLVAHTFPLEEANEAFAYAAQHSVFRVAIQPENEPDLPTETRVRGAGGHPDGDH
ncbi:MAG: zinc-binding dehydrogenase [Planctomycetaceae bacterium]